MDDAYFLLTNGVGIYVLLVHACEQFSDDCHKKRDTAVSEITSVYPLLIGQLYQLLEINLLSFHLIIFSLSMLLIQI